MSVKTQFFYIKNNLFVSGLSVLATAAEGLWDRVYEVVARTKKYIERIAFLLVRAAKSYNSYRVKVVSYHNQAVDIAVVQKVMVRFSLFRRIQSRYLRMWGISNYSEEKQAYWLSHFFNLEKGTCRGHIPK